MKYVALCDAMMNSTQMGYFWLALPGTLCWELEQSLQTDSLRA